MNKVEQTINRAAETPDYHVVNAGLHPELVLDCFIVPNGTYILKDNEFNCDSFVKTNAAFGIKTEMDDEVFQVWIVPSDPKLQEENNNWTDHGIGSGYDHCFFGVNCAPSVLPYSLLKDKKEGDEVELESNVGFKYKLRFSQLPYRYSRFGSFDEVVNSLHKRIA